MNITRWIQIIVLYYGLVSNLSQLRRGVPAEGNPAPKYGGIMHCPNNCNWVVINTGLIFATMSRDYTTVTSPQHRLPDLVLTT